MGGSWSGLPRTTRAASKPRTNGKVLEREGGGGKDGTGSTSGMLDMLQKMVPAVEGRNVPTAGKQETSEKRVQDPSNRLSTERLGDLYDRHAFGVAREETVDYEKLAANYGMKAELVERILKHTRKPNVVEKYVDGQPRLVAERDGT